MDEYDKYLGEDDSDATGDAADEQVEYERPVKPSPWIKIVALPKRQLIALIGSGVVLALGVVIFGIATQPDPAPTAKTPDKSGVTIVTNQAPEPTASPTTTSATSKPNATIDPAATPALTPADVQSYLPLNTASLDDARGTIVSGMTALTKTTWQDKGSLFAPEALSLFTGDPAAFVPLAGDVKLGDTVMLMANEVALDVTVGDTIWLVSATHQNGTWLISDIASTVINDAGGE